MQLSYASHDQQKARASSTTPGQLSVSASSSNHQKHWNSGNYLGGRADVNTFSVLAEPDIDNVGHESPIEDIAPGEARVAAVSFSGVRAQPSARQGVRLTTEQLDMLRRERRCFKCHKVGHNKAVCRSQAATSPPISLNSSAPSRT
jgi:hypothetical protein